MNKYIVKNCPNCNHTDWDNGYGELEEGYLCNIKIDDFECKDCDCLIKQVIERCKEKIILSPDYSTNAYSGGVYQVAIEILNLFERISNSFMHSFVNFRISNFVLHRYVFPASYL